MLHVVGLEPCYDVHQRTYPVDAQPMVGRNSGKPNKELACLREVYGLLPNAKFVINGKNDGLHNES